MCTLLDKFWRIWLYVADNAIAKLYVTYVKFRQKEGNGGKCRHIELTVYLVTRPPWVSRSWPRSPASGGPASTAEISLKKLKQIR